MNIVSKSSVLPSEFLKYAACFENTHDEVILYKILLIVINICNH